jgi:anti-sigma regulatory factor (Ser/Thr protein kinase)
MAVEKEPTGERRLALPRHPGAAAEARRFIAGLLRKRGVPSQTLENATLVSSELVTNAYRHGEGEIELRVALLDDRLRIEVVDAGQDQVPAVREQVQDEAGGWGLRIVDQLALQWGVFEGTTHVWADIALA